MLTPFLHASFETSVIDPRLTWHCEPARWAIHPPERRLSIEPDAGTDFWRRTHYGFDADNGHFLSAEVPGDFVVATHVRFRPRHRYDQAGLMVRASASCWLKTSVEYEPDGPSRLGAVVTNFAYSDWSTQAFTAGLDHVWLRVRREGRDYFVEAAENGEDWNQLRMAHLHEAPEADAVRCGLYACSPKGGGFAADFSDLRIDYPRS